MISDQQLARYNNKRNTAKAVETLLGILQGITADRTLNELEASFLNLWLTENETLHSDPDAVDLLDCLADTLACQRISNGQLNELKDLIDQIIQYRTPNPERDTEISNMNTLHGIIQGIMADQRLLDGEVNALNTWIEENPTDSWQYDALKTRLSEVLEDGTITERERFDLVQLLAKLGDNQFITTGAAISATTTLGTTEVQDLAFEEQVFCFTGTFLRGNRNTCEQLVIERGGKISSNITQKTKYLVLGSYPSKDWITSSYGRKIQQAIELQQNGYPITLITEEHWQKFI